MRKAAIDIGTNTTRLLIADYFGGDQFTPVFRREVITRLGGGFTRKRGIANEARERTVAALSEFNDIITDLGTESVVAVATSVVREASNKQTFVERAEKTAGIYVRVISGETEAALATRGALLPVTLPFDHALILDIGGGSTEFILTNGISPHLIESTDLGVVRLTEESLHHDPPDASELAALEQTITNRIRKVRKLFQAKGGLPFRPGSRIILVGIAGTPTTIAAIDLQMQEYDQKRITNHTLTRKGVEKIFQRLVHKTTTERLLIPGLQKGREDLIIPGLMITLGVMDIFELMHLRVIDSGILEGIILADYIVD